MLIAAWLVGPSSSLETCLQVKELTASASSVPNLLLLLLLLLLQKRSARVVYGEAALQDDV
jgi:hypothetical protein